MCSTFSRAPLLIRTQPRQGDPGKNIYYLDDAIFVLQPLGECEAEARAHLQELQLKQAQDRVRELEDGVADLVRLGAARRA